MEKPTPAEVFSPGEILREELEAREMTQADLAAIMGRPLQLISGIVTGRKSITTQTAQGLAAALGTSAEFWLNTQATYNLGKERESQDVDRRRRVFEIAPVNMMIKRKWIKKTDTVIGLEREVMRFFGANSLEECENPGLRVAARMSGKYDGQFTPTKKAWFARIARLGHAVGAAKFNRATFLSGLPHLHMLAANEFDVRRVPRLLADMGVRLVLVEHLKGTSIDGAVVWLNESTPCVALSLRYDRIDSFWFTLCHELMHIKNDDGDALDSDLVGKKIQPTEEKDEVERRADNEAADFLIPSDEIDKLVLRAEVNGRIISKVEINKFATKIQVHPGIVAGQLRRRMKNYSLYWDMLVKVRTTLTESALSDGWDYSPAI